LVTSATEEVEVETPVDEEPEAVSRCRSHAISFLEKKPTASVDVKWPGAAGGGGMERGHCLWKPSKKSDVERPPLHEELAGVSM
jgi:hypothetical protein